MSNETVQQPDDGFTLDEALAQPSLTDSPAVDMSADERVTEPVAPTAAQEIEAEDHQQTVSTLNAQQHYATSSPKTGGTPDTVAIPPAIEAVIMDALNRIPNLDITLSQNQQFWAEVLREGLKNLPMQDKLSQRLNEDDADFQQHLPVGGNTLRGTAPSLKKTPGTRELEGERALIQLVTHLGVGGLFRAPMWASGIWVTFKPATEMELLELNRMIYADKIRLGRWSYGLALSNNIVYSLDRVFEFALRHVYNTSVRSEELPIHELRKWIAPQDVYSFIWGFLCANYPSGFHYQTACINDPKKCNHVTQENLNVTKLQWVDNASLTDWQKQHMTSMAANSKTLDSLKKYREEQKRFQNHRVLLNKDTNHEIAITIKTPTMTEYVEQGHRWISGLVDAVNSVISESASEDERNAQINQLSKATTLCQYVHWIESIEYGDLSESKDGTDERSRNIITDQATIENTLKLLSATDSLREQIIDEVIAYINRSTVAVIGVPAFDCPACGMPQEGETVTYPRHASIIPLDVLQVFFALLHQRLGRIEIRSDL